MLLQEIIKKYKKKSWLRLCTLHGYNKWELIELIKDPVFPSKFFIDDTLTVTTRNCNCCGKELDLGIHKGSFIIKRICKCGDDGTHNMTFEKLRCVLTEEQSHLAVKKVFNSRKKSFPNIISFWIDQGFSIEEAEQKIIEVQTQRSRKSPATQKGAQGHSIRSKKYWMNQGYTEDEAREKVRQLQITNGLDYYRNKYGEKGDEMFNNRIQRWLNAEGNKKMTANRSKTSLELFEQLGVGNFGIDEKTVRGSKKVHRVDFIYGKKIIEFYGDYWHGNPEKYSSDCTIRNKKITDVWLHDANKIEDLKNNGYEVMIIWENDYKTNPLTVLEKCKEFIK